MTILQLLKNIEAGNTAMEMFTGQKPHERCIFVYSQGDGIEYECGYFDKAIDFEVFVRGHFEHEVIYQFLHATLTPFYEDDFDRSRNYCYSYLAIDERTGEVVGRVEMYSILEMYGK